MNAWWIFADRCIDFWWQSGGIQETVDDRMHDLSDAFCIVGPQSQARRISGINTSATQLRSDDGSTYFELNPDTRKIKLSLRVVLMWLPLWLIFSEKVTIHGLLTWMGGMVGSVVSGVASKITGAVEFLGSVKANGKPIDDTHTHGGVQRGGSNTDRVN
ncbi:putative phage related protein [Escherichia coli]|nr:putative phage related protein [Escherichia coli]